MRYNIGDRVGALLKADKDNVFLIGFGTYQGDLVPTKNNPDSPGGWMGEALIETGMKNPCIKLDNGMLVWGCECWWGPEEMIKNSIGDRIIIHVDIRAERKKA